MIKEELVEKIKKILALADSSNPNEAAVALARAQKLMAKYKIESHDLEDLTISEIKVKPITGLKSKECSIRLVSIISKCFGVENLLSYSGHSLTNIIFIGPKEILSSCEYVFTLLSRFALNAQRNFNETVWGETLGELIVDKQLMTIIEKINPQFYTDYLMNEQKTYQSAKENSGIRCREFLNFSGKRFQVYLDVYKDYDYEQCKKYFQKLVSKKRKAFLEGMLHEIYCKVQAITIGYIIYMR